MTNFKLLCYNTIMEKNTIICGDTIEELKKLPNESVDLIFADPPYWMRVEGKLQRVNGNDYDGCDDEWDNQFKTLEDYENFTYNWLSECKRVLKKDGSIWVIGGMQCIYTIGYIMQKLGYWFINDVVWFKKNPTPNFKGTRLNNAHETLIWAVKDKSSSYQFNYKTAKELNLDTVSQEEYSKGVRKQMGSVWRISLCQGEERLKDEEGNKLHSTQKPEELLFRIITISSQVGDLVLDPFGGTMTTGAVAKRLGRDFICIDNNKKYCSYGEARIKNIVPIMSNYALASFDKKPPKVTFEEMIKAKYFDVGEQLYYNNKPYLYLMENGKGQQLDGTVIDIHSAIGKIKNNSDTRLNGWDYWLVLRNGKLVPINDIRKKYLKEVKNYE